MNFKIKAEQGSTYLELPCREERIAEFCKAVGIPNTSATEVAVEGVYPSDRANSLLQNNTFNLDKLNCNSQNEFIEKAIRFYVSYITTDKNSEFLNPAIYHAIKAAIKESESRTATNLFRLAVEMGVAMNILAEGMDIPTEHIQDLRGKCITTVKKQRGKYTFEDAMLDANE